METRHTAVGPGGGRAGGACTELLVSGCHTERHPVPAGGNVAAPCRKGEGKAKGEASDHVGFQRKGHKEKGDRR